MKTGVIILTADLTAMFRAEMKLGPPGHYENEFTLGMDRWSLGAGDEK